MNAGDVALACMRAFVEALARRGVDAAYVAPGSRSTPLALALARDPRIETRVLLDERSAAFAALGRAKATGRPVAVVCTSGSAAANLFPAIVEARLGGVPLLALTADRPPELWGTGANQTIDQVEMFGGYPRLALNADAPATVEPAVWRDLAARAADAAVGSAGEPAAPVHVNLPFREPLTPSGDLLDVPGVEPPARAPGPSLESLCAADAQAVAARIAAIERGVIVVGWPAEHGDAVRALAEAAGWPLVAEPISGARVPGALGAPQVLLAEPSFADAHVPDLVLTVGGIPTTRAAQALCARAASVVTVSAFERRPMPGWRIDRQVRTDTGAFCRALARLLEDAPATAWAEEWREADAAARAALDAVLDAIDEPTELRTARDLAACLDAGSTLFVASSNPVRDLDIAMRPREGLRVLANRGASGIDGLVSTVLGIASSGAPTVGLLGDLALLHDASGLLWGASSGVDAVLVVSNNRGGGVFDLLPSVSLPEHERLFATPHDIGLAALAAAAGAGHERVSSASEVVAAVGRARSARGVRIVEVPIDRARALQVRAEVRAAVAAPLSGTTASRRSGGSPSP